ncbi:BgTH12-01244 [Blumeria graminis f. sp. triticale]|uniref:BgTH12-01244 n=1 Tax=Blumeria graminis f. sp. triticale TaxID=1689686 RepID=A0A9W4DC75_BLUGR|nr:BgTH12-01244 [Blumeria graminis f. sp. triticale]
MRSTTSMTEGLLFPE